MLWSSSFHCNLKTVVELAWLDSSATVLHPRVPTARSPATTCEPLLPVCVTQAVAFFLCSVRYFICPMQCRITLFLYVFLNCKGFEFFSVYDLHTHEPLCSQYTGQEASSIHIIVSLPLHRSSVHLSASLSSTEGVSPSPTPSSTSYPDRLHLRLILRVPSPPRGIRSSAGLLLSGAS